MSTAPENATEMTFADLGLPDDLLAAITQMGYEVPTPIQAEAIPALLELHDVVGIAQTGTGKTAAFGLPLLAVIDSDERHVQALVLAPTRELAMQSAQAISDFASHSRDIDVVPVYGGSAYGPQIGALKRGAQVVVGTPGRVIDLIEKGALDLSQVSMLVLDEADEMLRMGFAEDVETITSSVPSDRLTALFSATMPAAIEKIAQTHLKDPLKIAVSEESSTVDTIHQTYAVVPYKHKIGALSRVLATRAQHQSNEESDAAIVFVRTRLDVEEISLELNSRGFKAAGISGDVAQTERERMVERLKNGSLDVLVATDVAARGLDVERIGLVVNFDVPREAEAYVHRIGRTGRAGRQGRSLTFFTPREHSRLRKIEKLTGTQMEEVEIPSPAAVSQFRASRILDSIGERIEKGRLDLYRTLLEEELDESGEFARASFEGGRDRERPLKGRKTSTTPRHAVGTGTRYRIEVGKKDRVKPGAIVGAITGEGGISGADIGHIDIYPTFSLVEIHTDLSADSMTRISKAHVSGRALRIRVDEGPDGKSHAPKKSPIARKESREGSHRLDRGRGRHLPHSEEHRFDDRRGERRFGDRERSTRGGRFAQPQRKSASKKVAKRRFGR